MIKKRGTILIIAIFVFALILIPFIFNRHSASVFETCKLDTQGSKEQCYSEKIIKDLKQNGLESALNMMADIADNDTEFSQTCHSTMHEIGKISYENYQKTGKIKVNEKLSYCNYGFYHSFIEQMILVNGNIEGANKFCSQVGNNNTDSLLISNCYHGIGHGISSEPSAIGTAYEMSLPGLLTCKKIPETNGYRRSCQTGVFNSIAILYENPKYKLSPPQNAFLLCFENKYDDSERSACLLQMATFQIKLLNGDSLKIFSTALKINSKYRDEIFFDLATYSLQDKGPQEVVDACRKVSPESIPTCIKGVASGLKVYGNLGNEYERAIDFYRNGNLGSDEKELFLSHLLISDVNSKTEQEAVCSQFPPDMQSGPCKSI